MIYKRSKTLNYKLFYSSFLLPDLDCNLQALIFELKKQKILTNYSLNVHISITSNTTVSFSIQIRKSSIQYIREHCKDDYLSSVEISYWVLGELLTWSSVLRMTEHGWSQSRTQRRGIGRSGQIGF